MLPITHIATRHVLPKTPIATRNILVTTDFSKRHLEPSAVRWHWRDGMTQSFTLAM